MLLSPLVLTFTVRVPVTRLGRLRTQYDRLLLNRRCRCGVHRYIRGDVKVERGGGAGGSYVTLRLAFLLVVVIEFSEGRVACGVGGFIPFLVTHLEVVTTAGAL